MNPHLVLLLIALLYILIVGGLSMLRREGTSLQFVVEVIVVAGVLVILSLSIGQSLHPVLYLIIIYLITMRVRLMVDLGNLLAQRGHHSQASNLYNLALRLKPDGTGRQIVTLNQAVHHLKQGKLSEAITLLEQLLTDSQNSISPKHEAGARYNLAVAYRRRGNEAKAIVEFNKVIDVMPGSLYASGAQIALKKGRQQKETPGSPPENSKRLDTTE